MIMSVEEFKTFVETDMAEPLIEAKLQSLELLIRKYTNNNFQNRLYRRTADIIGGSFYVTAVPFKTGDTIQVSTTQLSNGLKVPCLNEGLFTIDKVDNNSFSVKEDVMDESNVLCTKIVYPMDVKMGVVNLMKWDMNNRDKVGIQSETISRHSVTYFNMDGDNSTIGFPKSLIGFLKPYIKARF